MTRNAGKAMGTDLAVIAADASVIEAATDPGRYVIEACERAKAWLANVLAHGEIEAIVEAKSQAEAIRVYTRQKELGKDAELAAAEVVRRAERGIGLAIRRGQAAGTINTRADGGPKPSKNHRTGGTKASPDEFLGHRGTASAQIYAMTDGISDDEFDEVIADAKGQGDLSRANLVRKIKNQRPTRTGRPEMLRKTRHHDSNRIVEQTVIALEGIRAGLDLIDYSALDRSHVRVWSGSLKQSVRSLNRLIKELNQ